MKKIDLDTYLGIVSVSEVRETLDIGPVMLVMAAHPTKGDVILVNSFEGCHALISH